MQWQTSKRRFDLAARPLVMGIVNVTLDSFSDGGKCHDPQAAIAHGLRLEAEGADILDIGGESTRPGAEPVAAEEELGRVLPVVRGLAAQTGCAISIDTYKAGVAREALEAGAEIVNDITGLRDAAMAGVVAETRAGAVIMHMQGEPRTMQRAPVYGDVIAEIREYFRQSFSRAITCGMEASQLVFDPGIGFGKTAAHNLTILRWIGELRVEGRPLGVGVSRKGFLAQVTGAEGMAERLAPTVAVTVLARAAGVNIFRVHDVLENVRALRMTDAILTPEP